MILLSNFRRNWIKLPNLNVLNDSKPIFLYLFSKDVRVNSEFFNIFSKDNEIGKKVESLGIYCYTQDISLLPTKYIDKLEIKTVPIVVGVYNGRNVGHIVNDGNTDKFMSLCDRLNSLNNSVEIDIVSNLKQLLSYGSLEDIRANVSYIKNNMIRELEVNPTLFKLVSEATIISNDNRELSLESINEDLEKLDRVIDEIEVYNMSGKFTGQNIEDTISSLNLDLLYEKYFNCSNKCTKLKDYGIVNSKDNKDNPYGLLENKEQYVKDNKDNTSTITLKTTTTTTTNINNENNNTNSGRDTNTNKYISYNLKMCYILKLHILKLVSVKYFIRNNSEKSLKNILEAYKLNTKLFQKNLFSIEEFELWDGREVLESMFSLFDPNMEFVKEGIADVENIIGKRNLNDIPVRTKPKGGVVKKRRGYGGRYIWQGMEYRPKKYKPKNLRQYLGDTQMVYESNPPSFN